MNTLTPDEVTILQMALSGTIEDLQASLQNTKHPFTPDARKMMKDMLTTAKTAHEKIAKASGQMIRLDPYQEGDEKEFLTKES